MRIFSFKKSYIGVDLGTSAIKMVELQNKGGRAILLTYGYAEQPTDIIRSSSTEMEEKIINIVKSVYKKSRMSSKQVIAALPSFSVFSSIINLPLMNKKDMAQAIQWEARKFIPLPLEEMTLDWKVIQEKKAAPKPPKSKTKDSEASQADKQDKTANQPNKNLGSQASSPANPPNKEAEKASQPSKDSPNKEDDASAKEKTESSSPFSKLFSKKNLFHKKDEAKPGHKKSNVKVLLTAAPKNLVEKYLRIFKAAELDLVSLETEAFALERSLASGDPSPIMIIDIGAVSSDVSIINNGIPILTRSIDVGGSAITKSVMTSLNVDLARAEQFKRDIGFSSAGPLDLPEVIKKTINPIVNEVKYCLDIYLSQGEHQELLQKIVLTGGSAFLPELVNYLSKLLDMKVIIGDPWDKIVYPLELKPVLAELGPRFAVAVGLAMREI